VLRGRRPPGEGRAHRGGAGGLKQEQWVQLTGTWLDQADHDAVNNELIPYVAVSSLEEIAPPDNQYES
jgi:uncharacterized membrane protein YcgQ (UPF0703/DUF1980 family)